MPTLDEMSITFNEAQKVYSTNEGTCSYEHGDIAATAGAYGEKLIATARAAQAYYREPGGNEWHDLGKALAVFDETPDLTIALEDK